MKTKGEAIIEKYTKLQIDLKHYFEKSLFPSLDEIDISDLCVLISMTFAHQTEEQIKETVIELIKNNNVVVHDFDKAYPLIYEFIMFFKCL